MTAKTWNFETRNCTFEVSHGSLSFNFVIASKGGGFTELLLSIGEEDVPVILEKLLLEMPNFEAQMLDTMRKVIELRRLQHDEQTRTLRALQDRLENASDSMNAFETQLVEASLESTVSADEDLWVLWGKVNQAINHLWGGLEDFVEEFAEDE